MTLDEAIQHCEEMAEQREQEAKEAHFLSAMVCMEYASEHRQLAKWLRELKAYKTFADWIAKKIVDTEDWDANQGLYSEIICRKLTRLGHIKCEDKTYEYVDMNISANDITDAVENWISD